MWTLAAFLSGFAMVMCHSTSAFTSNCCKAMVGNGTLSCPGFNVGFNCELTMKRYFGENFVLARLVYGVPVGLMCAVWCYRVVRYAVMPR